MENVNTLIQQINFDGDTMAVIERNGEQFVAMKPICEAFGLDWVAQRQLLNRDLVLNQVMCIMQNQSLGIDDKTYNVEMVCLPLPYLNGWLFKINPARYESERREKIIRYQRECYQVLFDHFFGKRFREAHSQTRQALRQERLFLTEKRNFDGLVKQEARRIIAGNGTIEDLNEVPTIQEAVRSALEKEAHDKSKDNQVNQMVALLNDIRADFTVYGDLHTRHEGIRIKIENGRFMMWASSRSLLSYYQKLTSPKIREPHLFKSARSLTEYLQAAETDISNQGWNFILNERRINGNRLIMFVYIGFQIVH